MLGYRLVGTGKDPVIMLHNWFGDSTTYDGIMPYLDKDHFQYVLVDLRGYGKSKQLEGAYTAKEVAHDVLEVADALGFKQFHLIGHSMSGMFAQYLAAHATDRVKSVIAITPVPACGSPMPPEFVEAARLASESDDGILRQFLQFATGNVLGEGFYKSMPPLFRGNSTHAARMGYHATFANTNFEQDVVGNPVPLLVIAGERDNPAYAPDAMRATLLKWFPHSKMVICRDSGHFPMIETPLLLAAYIERWLAEQCG